MVIIIFLYFNLDRIEWDLRFPNQTMKMDPSPSIWVSKKWKKAKRRKGKIYHFSPFHPPLLSSSYLIIK